MKEAKGIDGAFTSMIIGFALFCIVIGSCSSGSNKKAEEAYQRLKKEGFSNKQIYEMGK